MEEESGNSGFGSGAGLWGLESHVKADGEKKIDKKFFLLELGFFFFNFPPIFTQCFGFG
jgi:hypothetical protein